MSELLDDRDLDDSMDHCASTCTDQSNCAVSTDAKEIKPGSKQSCKTYTDVGVMTDTARETGLDTSSLGSSLNSHVSSLRMEATWARDSDKCHLCQAKFSLGVRRHHCRSCGECVCSGCSPYRVQLDHPVSRPAEAFSLRTESDACRQCKNCHGRPSLIGDVS